MMANKNIIVNPHRKKQIEEFVDKDHRVMDRYYELLEQDLDNRQLKKEMEELIKRAPLFFDPYLIIVDILEEEENFEEVDKILEETYLKAIKRIVDKDSNWPQRMEWGWLENRHILRTIDKYAFNLWQNGKTKEALEIFRKILKVNSRDNTGARYYILAIKLGLNPDFEWQFEAKEYPGLADASKMAEWFEKESKKFSDEFD